MECACGLTSEFSKKKKNSVYWTSSLRLSHEAFDLLFESTVKEAEAYTEMPTIPRKRKLLKRFNDDGPQHRPSSPKELFRQSCFEVIDELKCNLDKTAFSVT